MKIKILLVDDHNIFRQGLRSLFDSTPGMLVLAEAKEGREALKLVRKYKPDVVVMDIDMPDLNGIDCTHKILEEFETVKIVMLSMHPDRQLVIGALRAGASGYLLKDSDFEELKRAVRYVHNGQTYLTPQIAGTVVRGYMDKLIQMDDTRLGILTVREREVLQLVAEGKGTKEIAVQLNLSTKTIEYHRRNIMDKLDIHTIAELTKFAIREKLTSV